MIKSITIGQIIDFHFNNMIPPILMMNKKFEFNYFEHSR